MKHIPLALLLALVLLLSLGACGKMDDLPPEQPMESAEPTPAAELPDGEGYEYEPEEGAPLYSVVADPWEVYVPQRQILLDTGSMLGVVFLGGSASHDLAQILSELKDSEQANNFDFLWELPEDRFVTDGSGYELYLILPYDSEGAMEVWTWNVDGEDEPLFSANDGAPILLQCNAGDLPSVQVEVFDSAWNRLHLLPCLSGEDGSVVTSAEVGTLYDFTIYE